MTRTGKVAKLGQHERRPFAELHPDDAARLGVREGRTVEIASRYGMVRVPARLSAAIKPGVVFSADALGTHGYAARRRRARQQRHQPARRSPFQGARLQIHRGRRPAGGGGAATRVRGGRGAGGAGVRARISHAQPGRSDPGAQRRARAVLQPRAAGRVPGRQAALGGAAVDHGRGARRAGSGPASRRSGNRHRPRPQMRAGRLRAGAPLRPAGAGHRQPRPPPARPAGGT